MDHQFWENVIFTDEKYFTSVEARARHCWRRDNSRYVEKIFKKRARSGRVGVNFWGWMWAQVPGELVKLSGRFTGDYFVEVLEEVFLQSVRTLIPEPLPITMVQDNSPKHRSNVAKEWLNQHPEIQVINWPAKGCDLNPIGNLWAIMARDWDVGNNAPAIVLKEELLKFGSPFEVWRICAVIWF